MDKKHVCLVCGKGNAIVTQQSWGQGTKVETKCPDCEAVGVLSNQPAWKGFELSEKTLRALFDLSGIEIIGLKQLQNGYWGQLPDGAYPWWFVKTSRGWIEIGWRKRVLSIDWKDTDIRTIVTSDNVTKDDTGVHAWSEEKALEYLKSWAQVA